MRKTTLLTLLALTVYAGVVTAQAQSKTDSLVVLISGTYTDVDGNGVVIDRWDYNNNWEVCQYKVLDIGLQCILHSDNQLYIFYNRKLLHRYRSSAKITRNPYPQEPSRYNPRTFSK